MTVADTDVLIDALNRREPAASRVERELRTGQLAVTAVTVFELQSGAKSGHARQQIARLLAAIKVLVFDDAAAASAAEIRRTLEGRGTPIGMAHYLIAGICLSRSAVLLTRNRDHFARVPGLQLGRFDPRLRYYSPARACPRSPSRHPPCRHQVRRLLSHCRTFSVSGMFAEHTWNSAIRQAEPELRGSGSERIGKAHRDRPAAVACSLPATYSVAGSALVFLEVPMPDDPRTPRSVRRGRRTRREATPSVNLAAMRLDAVRRVFDSDAAVADALGVSRAQPPRWREGQMPEPENAHKLAGLDVVIDLLTGYLEPETIPEWLNGLNPFLQDRTPLFMLQKGRLAEVIAAIQAEQSEGYA